MALKNTQRVEAVRKGNRPDLRVKGKGSLRMTPRFLA